jgi:hypothetical protein
MSVGHSIDINRGYALARLPFLGGIGRLYPGVHFSLCFWKCGQSLLIAYRGTNPSQVLLPSLGEITAPCGKSFLLVDLSFFWVDKVIRTFGGPRRRQIREFLKSFSTGWGVTYCSPFSAELTILQRSWASEILGLQFGDLDLPFPLSSQDSELHRLIRRAFPETGNRLKAG